MPTLHTTTYTSVFSGQNVSPSFPQYNSFTITGNIQLAWAASFQNLNPVVAVNMDITASAGGFTVMMPDAEGAGTGYAITINNPGTFSFNLIDNLSNLIVTIPAGTTKQIWLIDNSTQGGIWRTFPNPGGGSAVTSINATSGSNNLLITGAPGLPIINAGTIQFNLANDLLALTSFGASSGIAVRTAANTWALRSINGTAGQILVANPQGIAGNITISLSNVLTNLVSIGVGNLSLSANTIASTNANGPIILVPQGTGLIQLSNNTQIMSGSSLKYFNAANNFYVSFKTGTTSVNQDLIWPTTAPGNGQVLQHNSLGQLQWASVPTTGGTTTLNSVARYSNTGGALTDSPVILDSDGNMTGIMSAQINNILIGTIGRTTITTQLTDQDLTFSPNGLGFCISKTDFLIRRNAAAQSRLKLYNDADNFYAGIIANPNMTASYTWQLPLAGNVAGFFFTDATNTMSITPIGSFFPAVSTLNAVPRYSNTTGSPLKDSVFVITDAGAGSGLTSQTVGNISLNLTADTISSTTLMTLTTPATLTVNGSSGVVLSAGAGSNILVANSGAGNISLTAGANLTLTAPGANAITANNDINFKAATPGTARKAIFYNAAGTFFSSIQAAPGTALNLSFTLPPSISAAYLRSDSIGNLSLTSIGSSPNQVAKYSDAFGTLTTASVYMDANSNVSIGDTTVPGGAATHALVFNTGVAATSISASHLSLQSRDTGAGIVPSWYGAGNGGVSASVAFASITNKISIYVNGTRYYLLASTNAT